MTEMTPAMAALLDQATVAAASDVAEAVEEDVAEAVAVVVVVVAILVEELLAVALLKDPTQPFPCKNSDLSLPSCSFVKCN
jgi:hypothetical protein